MSVQRQYVLPNVSLILDGFEDVSSEGSSLMSILSNAECHFIASNKHLSGGQVFLENLAKSVSKYTQGFLSGLSHPQEKQEQYPYIRIDKIESESEELHRITLESDPQENESPKQVDITTVELFDLVEAVDKLYSDSETLPDLSLKLEPLSKRFRQPDEPLTQRLVPFLVGTASLVFAGSALFFMPPPEVNESNPVLESVPTETVPVESESKPLDSESE